MKRIKLIFIDLSLWLIWFPLRIIVQHLPVGIVNFIGHLGGIFLYQFAKKKRQIMMEEISFLFSKTLSPDLKEIRKMTKRGLSLFSKRQMENLYWGSIDGKLIDRILSIEGREHLDKALAEGKGVLLITAHFGSHLLPPLALGYKGYTVNQIAGTPLIEKQRPIYQKIFKARERESEKLPIRYIVAKGALRQVFQALRRNEVVFVAFDGKEGEKWITVDFFGHKAIFSPGPFKLAFKTGACVLPVFTIRQSDDRHLIVIEPPFDFDSTEDGEEMHKINTARFAKKMEGYIYKYPCHYAGTLMSEKESVQEGALKFGLFQG